jgi:hypothetical protein
MDPFTDPGPVRVLVRNVVRLLRAVADLEANAVDDVPLPDDLIGVEDVQAACDRLGAAACPSLATQAR